MPKDVVVSNLAPGGCDLVTEHGLSGLLDGR